MRALQQLGVVLEPHERGREPERVLHQERPVHRLHRGQKKKMTVTAICGATSAYGSHFDWKTTRFSMRRGGR
jgi:hypothetical protein